MTVEAGSLYVPTADRGEESLRDARASLYGQERESVEVWTTRQADEAFTAELRGRVRSDRDAVVLVWGDPGSGKSTFVLDRMRKLDPTFTPSTISERVAFRASEVASLYDQTPRYGAAWIDEAGSVGLLASEPPNSLRQRRLIELINIIRANNVVLFVVIPSPDDLCKGFRVRRADYRVECEPPVEGKPVGIGYLGRKVPRRHFFLADSRWLGFSDDSRGKALVWPEYRGNADPDLRAYWDAYEPLKTAFRLRRTKEIQAELLESEEDG